MPGSTISVCNDPAEFEAALQVGGDVKLYITRRGRFWAQLIRIALPRASLLLTEESSQRIAFVSPASDVVVVVVPLDREPPQTWAGTPIRLGEILTLTGGQPVHARTAGPCRTGIIYLSAELLARVARTLINPKFVLPTDVQRWHPSSTALQPLIRLLHAVSRVTSAHPAIPANADAARGLEQELATAVVECLSGQPVEAETAVRERQSKLMVCLEEVIRARPDRLLPLTNICAALGVSQRTLRTYCEKHLGMTPSRYFRLRQFQRIYRALRCADPTKTTVSEVARRYGVTELGRFAGSYRDLFGELPSITMRRAALALPAGERADAKAGRTLKSEG